MFINYKIEKYVVSLSLSLF